MPAEECSASRVECVVMPKTRSGVSYWVDRFPQSRRPSYARHRGELDLDVAVIGGGFTGCATAQALATAGVRVGVFEAERIGQGASAASTALVMQEPDVDFQDLVASRGLRAARRIWQMTRRAAFDLGSIMRRLNVQCQLEAYDSIYLASGPAATKRLRRELDARRQAGLDARWLTPDKVRRETNLRVDGAIRVSGNAQIDPYRACLGLVAAAVKRGAVVYEHSPVTRVRFSRKDVQLRTERGSVTADHLIVATGHPTALFKPLARHFRTLQTYVVMTPPLGAKIRSELGRRDAMLWDTDEPYHYLRWTKDDRIIFGGADRPPPHPRQRDKVLIQRTGQLMYELSTRYPVISGIQPEYAWDGACSVGADGVPCIGTHRNYPRHLFALGYGGNGLALGFLASRILTRHYLGEPASGDDLFPFAR